MLFFRKSARPRRAHSAPRSRLSVEQLEARLTPCMLPPPLTIDSPLMSITSSSSPTLGGPVVGTDSNGDYDVSWSNKDSSGPNVYAQRFSSAGVALGSIFRVNTASGYSEQDPSIALDSAGDCVITWASYGQDGSGWGVFGQRYNSLGVAQGGEFQINTTTAGDQMHARVAMDAAGNFTVVWQSYGQDGNGWGVFGQRYNALGQALGGEFQINNTSAGDQAYPAIAMNATGAFVVTWSSYGQDGSGWGVYARRYNSSGNPQGNEFLVNTTTTGDQMYSSAGIDTAGDFVISWTSDQTGNWCVYTQRFYSSGTPRGGESLVGSTTGSTASFSTVAMDGAGNYIVTWSNDQSGSWSNYAEQFSANGRVLTSQFQIGTTSATYQTYAGISITASGLLVLVSNGTDSSGNNDVFAELGYNG